ncbi:hypothetical protein AVEN_81959-1 [Araneus ventricosus]|uniref:Uncharacterized protein n=1 Tax=Araneus ventricosus TaxID=182803 RepID=A0A4Y2IM48_ARAVE|nr:hypothetical protein AVEN_81959-1 [Araneus ventricosus]
MERNRTLFRKKILSQAGNYSCPKRSGEPEDSGTGWKNDQCNILLKSDEKWKEIEPFLEEKILSQAGNYSCRKRSGEPEDSGTGWKNDQCYILLKSDEKWKEIEPFLEKKYYRKLAITHVLKDPGNQKIQVLDGRMINATFF